MKLIHKIKEGEEFQPGINVERTSNGHSVHLQIHLPKSYRLRVGYYWGKRFHPHFAFWNQVKELARTREFERMA